jgi:hypothetical protein
MKKASTATTRTRRSSGPTNLSPGGATPRAKPKRKRPPTIVLVVACSQRKRIAPLTELRLSSITASAPRRPERWRSRLRRFEAASHVAQDLYMGDHWHAARQAYQLAQRYSTRTELWIVSAGYGLIAADDAIKPYSATFSSGLADSVWRGPVDGDRDSCLQRWWAELAQTRSLAELVPRGDGALVLVAGAAYLTAVSADLETALSRDPNSERVSVVSAGTRGNGALLPVDGRFRGLLGGTDSSLNARLLVRLAADASTHRFRRPAMAEFVTGMAQQLIPSPRRHGRSATDGDVLVEITAMRSRRASISRTQALRDLRSRGVACEQTRFASLWRLSA